ncbi:MAG: RlmE family RNA methyltransferase [Alphaproteobacteria bacterium]
MRRGRPRGRSPGAPARTVKGRKPSSTRWLARQLTDPYVTEAQRRGYRSRAAFKLIEIDHRCGVLSPGKRVVDLGAAPGGWTQVAVERVRPGSTDPASPTSLRPPKRATRRREALPEAAGGRVVAMDVTAMEPVPGAEILRHDVCAADAHALLKRALGGSADVLLSDMAPPFTGHRSTDHLRVVALVEAALGLADKVLAPGGVFVAKALEGGAGRELIAELKRRFGKVRHVKPRASRKESAETYIVATGFRGGAAA